MATNDPVRIDPSSQYLISGAALLSVADLLNNNLPCKYIGIVDRAASILGTAKVAEITKSETSSDISDSPRMNHEQ